MTHAPRKRLLMVGGWKEVYDKALDAGLELVALDSPARLTGLGDGPGRLGVPIAIDDTAACLTVARDLHAERPFAAVVSFAELGLASAAHIGEALQLPANPPRPVVLTRDKLLMRQALAEAGHGSVRFRRCGSANEVAAFLAEIGGPIVIKPVDGAGSRGVTRVAAQADVPAAWRWSTAAGDDAVLAEEYIRGRELSVDAMSFDGRHHVIAIAEKLTTGAPHFIETGHQLPARIDTATGAAIARTVIALLDTVDQRHGPSHTEVKVAGGDVKVIETQTRTGGDQIWEMVQLALGLDMHRAALEHLVHGRSGPLRTRRGAAAIRFFTAQPMTLDRIEGVGRAGAVPGVVRVRMEIEPGETVGPLAWSRSRLGYVLAKAETVEAAVESAEHAFRHVRLVPRESERRVA